MAPSQRASILHASVKTNQVRLQNRLRDFQTNVSFSFTWHLQHRAVTAPCQVSRETQANRPQPSHRALLSFGRRRKRMKSYTKLLKLCLEMTHLFTSAHILFSRENWSHGSAWVQGDGDKDASSCIRYGINVGERSCRQLLVFLPYSAFSHTRPLSSQKEVDSPFSEPLEAKCISGSEFFICYGITIL